METIQSWNRTKQYKYETENKRMTRFKFYAKINEIKLFFNFLRTE